MNNNKKAKQTKESSNETNKKVTKSKATGNENASKYHQRD